MLEIAWQVVGVALRPRMATTNVALSAWSIPREITLSYQQPQGNLREGCRERT